MDLLDYRKNIGSLSHHRCIQLPKHMFSVLACGGLVINLFVITIITTKRKLLYLRWSNVQLIAFDILLTIVTIIREQHRLQRGHDRITHFFGIGQSLSVMVIGVEIMRTTAQYMTTVGGILTRRRAKGFLCRVLFKVAATVALSAILSFVVPVYRALHIILLLFFLAGLVTVMLYLFCLQCKSNIAHKKLTHPVTAYIATIFLLFLPWLIIRGLEVFCTYSGCSNFHIGALMTSKTLVRLLHLWLHPIALVMLHKRLRTRGRHIIHETYYWFYGGCFESAADPLKEWTNNESENPYSQSSIYFISPARNTSVELPLELPQIEGVPEKCAYHIGWLLMHSKNSPMCRYATE